MVPFWSATLLAITLGLAGAFHLLLFVTDDDAADVVAADGVRADRRAHRDGDHHRSRLVAAALQSVGTFDSISSVVFNGTLIAGGLLVTTFAVYVGNDMRVLADRGLLGNAKSPRTVAVLFVVMGIMLAGVGLVPVDVNLAVHNLSATGMAIVYVNLPIAAPRLFKGMPRTFFVTSWGFLAATVLSIALFVAVLRADRVRDHRLRPGVRLDRDVHPIPGRDRPAHRAPALTDAAKPGASRVAPGFRHFVRIRPRRSPCGTGGSVSPARTG